MLNYSDQAIVCQSSFICILPPSMFYLRYMERVLKGFVHSETCKGCNAVDPTGTLMREFIDKKKEEGTSTPKLINTLAMMGVRLQQPALDRHFRNHSPFTRDNRLRALETTKKGLDIQRENHRNVEEELQKLVDIGGDRVDEGSIIVDKDLYMFAIDRKLKDGTPVSIQNLLINFTNTFSPTHS